MWLTLHSSSCRQQRSAQSGHWTESKDLLIAREKDVIIVMTCFPLMVKSGVVWEKSVTNTLNRWVEYDGGREGGRGEDGEGR